MSILMRILSVSGLFIITACASVLNPYESEFTCPQSELGTCAPVKTVYSETKAGITYPTQELDCLGESDRSGGDSCPLTESGADKKPTELTEYARAKNSKLSILLRDPQTPIAIPPKVMRIAILPYVGKDNELYMPRYVYVFVDSPEWVISNIKSVEE